MGPPHTSQPLLPADTSVTLAVLSDQLGANETLMEQGAAEERRVVAWTAT